MAFLLPFMVVIDKWQCLENQLILHKSQTFFQEFEFSKSLSKSEGISGFTIYRSTKE